MNHDIRMNLDALVAAALAHMRRSIGTSAGLHAMHLRRLAEQMRQNNDRR